MDDCDLPIERTEESSLDLLLVRDKIDNVCGRYKYV